MPSYLGTWNKAYLKLVQTLHRVDIEAADRSQFHVQTAVPWLLAWEPDPETPGPNSRVKDPRLRQGLLFWLLKGSFKVSSGTVEQYMEAVMLLTLMILK